MSFKIATKMRWIRISALAFLLGGCDGSINNQEVRKTLTTVVNLNSQNQLSDDYCQYPVVSEDGHIVAFFGMAENLVPDPVASPADNIYVRDILQQTTICGSVNTDGVPGNAQSGSASLSGNGQYLVFLSVADDLIDVDSNSSADIFIRDLVSGTTSLVSQTWDEAQLSVNSSDGCASWDGRWVAFTTSAKLLVENIDDTDDKNDVFVRDIDNGNTIAVSWDPTAVVPTDTGDSRIRNLSSAFSKDNRFIIFESTKDDLHPDADNGLNHVFLRDLSSTQSDAFELISRRKGENGLQADEDSYMGGISYDGRYVAFTSSGIETVDDVVHVYVRDRIEHTTTRVSKDSTGGVGDGYNGVSIGIENHCVPSISGDGNIVVFAANDLSHLDQTPNDDIYAHNLTTGITLLVSVSTGSHLQAEEHCEGGVISGDGSTILFYSNSLKLNNLIPANNSQNNIFRRGTN